MKAIRTVTHFYLSRAKASLQVSSNLSRWSLGRAGNKGAVSISTRELTVDNVSPQSHSIDKRIEEKPSEPQQRCEENNESTNEENNETNLSWNQRLYNWMHSEIDDCDVVAPYCQHYVALNHKNDQ